MNSRNWIENNPMLFEGVRTWRRFLRSGGDTSRGINATILSIIGVCYLWVLLAMIRAHEDWSMALLAIELTVVTMTAPALAYAAISGERERLTWDALVLTPLSASKIVVGKFLWRVLVVTGILLLGTPLLLISHAVGQNTDYSLSALLRAQAIVWTWGVLVTAFTFYVSAKTKRTATTLAISVGMLLAVLALLPTLVVVLNPGMSPDRTMPGALVFHLHPVIAVMDYAREAGRQSTTNYSWLPLDRTLPLVYLAGTVFFLYKTWRVLKGLEVPLTERREARETREAQP